MFNVQKYIKNREAALICIAGAALAACGAARAADAAASYPSKPIRIVVPTAPGGGVDTLARIIGQKLTESWGQQVIVDDRGGASGIIGTELAARAPADGHTLLMVPTAFAINASLFAKLPYSPENDFAPVTIISSEPNFLVVHPSLPVRTVKELIALARRRSDQLNYSFGGLGSTASLSGELFNQMAGVTIVGISYKGNGPAMTALIAGEVSLMFSGLPAALPSLKSARLRALAVTSTAHSPFLPNVPTMAEAGLPGYEVTNWIGLLAPSATPREIVGKLNAEVVRQFTTSAVRERFAAFGVVPAASSPRQFAVFIKSEIAKWDTVIKQAGIRAN